jgi:hypothetical protein
MTWHDAESARDQWSDAPLDDDTLDDLLEVARVAVLAYAPVMAEGAEIPVSYAAAQLMQARNVWNSSKVSTSGEFGGGDYVLRPHPLDWQVKQLIRPRRAVPRVR